LDESLTFCVHLGALFHDVGRFPQYARYGTFNDRISVDHGRMSVNVLRESGVLDSLPDRDRRVVLASVFLHNKPSLPEHLHFRLKCVVRILRDADKLDIFKVILPHLSPDAPENDVITLAVKPHPTAYTPKILERLRQRKPVRYEDMAWMNDLKLMLCGWIYDFNFDVARQLVGERRYLERLFETLPRTPEFVELAGRLEEDLRRAVGGR
jgi:hypothetical protein